MDKSDIAIVIQAGGQSSRMGQNKALLDLNGKTIIEHTLDQISALSDDHNIISDDPQLYSFLPNTRVITDLFPGRGPLGGLVTAFVSVTHPYLVMCACDMPFASQELFKLELEILVDEQLDVVLPQLHNRPEPLHAVYRRQACLQPAQNVFLQGGRKIIDWFPQVRVKILDDAMVGKIDPLGRAFFNINTPEDYAKAQIMVKENAG